jgi:hypothetical protein
LLTRTDARACIVDEVTDLRRDAISEVLGSMPARRRQSLVPALTAFAKARRRVA